jgi:flavin reductase (DIM6/NTAB) family NADH-FMN oxidoreductase RutF
VPTAPSPDEFRRALARFPTGVTVVTAPGDDGPLGATADAVTSLSLEPPLMLACLDRGSRTLLAVREAGRFAINLLHAGQEELARGFSTKAPHPDKWLDVGWADLHGVPVIDDVPLWIACEVDAVHPGGDHEILVGEVAGLGIGSGGPLLFHGGGYVGLD